MQWHCHTRNDDTTTFRTVGTDNEQSGTTTTKNPANKAMLDNYYGYRIVNFDAELE